MYRRPNPLTLVPVALLACGLFIFHIPYHTSVEVPGSGILGDVLAVLDFSGLNDLDFAIHQELEDQGVEPGDLREVVITSLSLSADPDLAFLDSISIYVSAPGVPEERVAHGEGFPQGENLVELTLDEVDLTEAIVAGALTFRVEVDGSAPTYDTEIDVDVSLKVTATSRGACRAARANREATAADP